jgi:hypothetical protein
VTVKPKTHSFGASPTDFPAARKIEDTVLWRPEPGGHGSDNKFVVRKK